MGEKINSQLFIGMSSISGYANQDLLVRDFNENVIKKTFDGFKSSLPTTIKNFDKENNVLYDPISFNALGFYNSISVGFVDDYHFGNFSYRPNNVYIENGATLHHQSPIGDKSNFQFQVTNGYNVKSVRELNNKDLHASIKKSPIISICKIKINSSLLIGNDSNPIERIKDSILDCFKNDNFQNVLIANSFSWHELILVILSNDLTTCLEGIRALRNKKASQVLDVISPNSLIYYEKSNIAKEERKEYLQHYNLVTDTETYFGFSQKLFDASDTSFYKNFVSQVDDSVSISTKLQIKTGHLAQLNKILDDYQLNQYLEKPIEFVNGKSDYKFKYKTNSLINFISFWRDLSNDERLEKNFFSHVRKIHSNASILAETKQTPLTNNNSSFYNKLFQSFKFKHSEIIDIENKLTEIKISKELCNSVLTLYTNYNHIVCDVNLSIYYLELRPLLISLREIISLRAKSALQIENQGYDANQYDERDYYRIKNVSKLILQYVNTFKIAYTNRFMDSKKHGYNLDSKGEFNGGVHQIIMAYDIAYKIIYKDIREIYGIGDTYTTYTPVATYGDYVSGIVSGVNNLHISYFHLFQSEYFLYTTVKEALNFAFKGFFKDKEQKSYRIKDLESIISTEINKIKEVNKRRKFYRFFPPNKIKVKILYILEYYFFIKEIDLSFEDICFWFLGTLIQNSNLYNINGSLNFNKFCEHFFSFYVICDMLYEKHLEVFEDRNEFFKVAPFQDVIYYLYDCKVLEDCKEVLTMAKGAELDIEDLPELDDAEKAEAHWWRIYIVEAINSIEEQFENSDKSPSSSFLEIIDLIKKYLPQIRIKMTKSNFSGSSEDKDLYAQYVRKPNGKGVIFSEIEKLTDGDIAYHNGVFDSRGGTFIIDYNTRIDIMNLRLAIIEDLKRIAYTQKRDYIDRLV